MVDPFARVVMVFGAMFHNRPFVVVSFAVVVVDCSCFPTMGRFGGCQCGTFQQDSQSIDSAPVRCGSVQRCGTVMIGDTTRRLQCPHHVGRWISATCFVKGGIPGSGILNAYFVGSCFGAAYYIVPCPIQHQTKQWRLRR